AKRYQKDAVRIDTTDRTRAHADIEYRAMRIAPNEIEHAVVNVLRYFEAPGALVFCSTRESVKHLQAALRERGFSSVGLSGELSQRERTDALQALRDGHARVCVATDVAARGLDLPDLGLVLHAELPVNRATLLHRSGRTGRAGKKGVSVLLVPNPKRRRAEMLLSSAGVEATWEGAPTADAIRAQDDARLLAADIFSGETSDEDMALARKLLAERSADEMAVALVRMLRAKMPAPEDLTDPGDRPLRKERGDAATAWPTERLQAHEVTWFRASVGRQQNADPKWLIPLICRLGGVTKRDIGSIRVLPDETRFEISLEASEKFQSALANAAKGEPVTITPSSAPDGAYKVKRAFSPRREEGGEERPRSFDRPRSFEHKGPPKSGKAPYAGKANAAKAPYAGKPYAGKPGGKPFKGKPFKKAAK
ncbi:MAG: DEAD/DEAH box helicase, partial [Brevundimonas sp.]